MSRCLSVQTQVPSSWDLVFFFHVTSGDPLALSFFDLLPVAIQSKDVSTCPHELALMLIVAALAPFSLF
jgi:hypothetical protein